MTIIIKLLEFTKERYASLIQKASEYTSNKQYFQKTIGIVRCLRNGRKGFHRGSESETAIKKLVKKSPLYKHINKYLWPVAKNKGHGIHFHKFHILDPSPWPFFICFAIFTLMVGIVVYLHKLQEGQHDNYYIWMGVLEIVICSFLWWHDVTYEAEEDHTEEIRYGLKVGMVLFIISEIMFFFSFFWAFFHLSLSPSIFAGSVWPPIGLSELIINPFGVPLLNTVLLLSSGITVTIAHYELNVLIAYMRRRVWLHQLRLLMIGLETQTIMFSEFRAQLMMRFRFAWGLCEMLLRSGRLGWYLRIESYMAALIFPRLKWRYMQFLAFTIALAILFTGFQIFEYVSCDICLSDGIFGSTFYMLTGFHGLHVLIGTIFLTVCWIRALRGHFDDGEYVGLECAIWYWHFVDVVWLFLYIFVYLWGKTIRIVGLCPDLLFEVLGSESYGIEIMGLVSNKSISNEKIVDFSKGDFAVAKQIGFQDPASFVMENIILLHNYVMFFLILIFSLVAWFFVIILVLQYSNLEATNKHFYKEEVNTYTAFLRNMNSVSASTIPANGKWGQQVSLKNNQGLCEL
jgi:cytochrome c oxidase subunit 3